MSFVHHNIGQSEILDCAVLCHVVVPVLVVYVTEGAVRALDGVELELVLLGVGALLPGLVDAITYEPPVEYEIDVL